MSFFHDIRGDRRGGLARELFAARIFDARLSTEAQKATHHIDRFLHRMIEALAAAKMRRLHRELQFRGVSHSQAARQRLGINSSHNGA